MSGEGTGMTFFGPRGVNAGEPDEWVRSRGGLAELMDALLERKNRDFEIMMGITPAGWEPKAVVVSVDEEAYTLTVAEALRYADELERRTAEEGDAEERSNMVIGLRHCCNELEPRA